MQQLGIVLVWLGLMGPVVAQNGKELWQIVPRH